MAATGGSSRADSIPDKRNVRFICIRHGVQYQGTLGLTFCTSGWAFVRGISGSCCGRGATKEQFHWELIGWNVEAVAYCMDWVAERDTKRDLEIRTRKSLNVINMVIQYGEEWRFHYQ